jgi:hypothetical protein
MEEQPFLQFSQQINEKFIMPEIEKRKAIGSLPLEFKIYECLIKFPKNQVAIVQFNKEIGWIAKAKRGDGLPFVPDKEVYLHEIIEIESVEAPEVNGERVAFHYLFWNGLTYQVICDFTPNWPDEFLKPEDKKWSLSGIITRHLQARLTEDAVKLHDIAQKDLQRIGLWAVPALLPYPLVKI